MKTLVHNFFLNPKYSKIFEWGRLLSVTGGAQAMVQIFALLSGILVVRFLPTREYAYYTLANTMLSTMTILADGGIGTGIMAQGGKVWRDKTKLGVVLATGLKMRRTFAIGSLLVSVPILIYLLKHHGANWITILLIVAALVPAFFAALSDSLLEIVPKLHQNIKPLQKNQIVVGFLRLVFSGVFLFIFPWTFIALLANGIPRIYGNFRLKVIAYTSAEKNSKEDPVIKSEILSVVKRIMPGAIYYSLSGQLNIWLMSIFGTTQSLAQIGALGRLSILLTVFTMVFSMLIIPRYSRLPSSKKVLTKKFFQICLVAIFICLVVILGVYLFSNQILWVLGSRYKGLNIELLLSMVSASLGMLSGVIFSLGSCRGWVLNPIITISMNIGAVIVGILIFNLSTVEGVLIFNIFVSFINLVRSSVYNIIQLKR